MAHGDLLRLREHTILGKEVVMKLFTFLHRKRKPAPKPKKTKRTVKCTSCGEKGHNSRKCPHSSHETHPELALRDQQLTE